MALPYGSLLTMSSFEALYALLKYRDKYSNHSDYELIQLLKRYPETSSLDYQRAIKLEQIIEVDHHIDILISLRKALRQIILTYRPTWMYAIPYGRNEVMNNLDDQPNIKQCFKSAHLLDVLPPQEITDWWDELIQLVRAEKDAQKVKNGREGERLSLEYEKRRLMELGISQSPKWIALEDNTVGYDIKSYDMSDYGPINKLIEVKSCSSDKMTIFLTRNEWKKAIEYKDNYYFHIWHLPSRILVHELSVSQMEPYILSHKENTKWTNLEISFDK